MNSLTPLLQSADQAARRAGQRLRQRATGATDIHLEDGKDIKLRADLETEQLVRDLLKGCGLPIIGEEQGGDASLTSLNELYWVVDPLDGTHNYYRDVPLTCVSIGLMRGERPVLGAIYDFCRDELYSGIAGEGVTLNGRPLIPKWETVPEKATLQTGFPVAMNQDDGALKAFMGKVQRFQKVRALGSAALALAWVAHGRFDAYYEEGIRLWDIAAGLALVEAAGGSTRMVPAKNGKPLSYDVWAASCVGLMQD